MSSANIRSRYRGHCMVRRFRGNGPKVYKSFFDENPVADFTTMRTFLQMVPSVRVMGLIAEYGNGQDDNGPRTTIHDGHWSQRHHDTNYDNYPDLASRSQEGIRLQDRWNVTRGACTQ